MSVDISKMKKKLDNVQNGGGGGGKNLRWKPDMNSKHRLRVLLPNDGTGDPFKDFKIHYQIGEQFAFLCPKSTSNEDCPVCEFGSELWQEGENLDSQYHKDLAKDLWPADRFYSAVVEIEKGSDEIIEGPAWYAYSKTVYESFLKYMVDDEYNTFTNVDDGHDVKLEYTKGEDDRYPSTEIDLAPRPSPITTDSKKNQELFDNIPPVDEVVTELSMEEINKALDQHIAEEKESDEGKEELDKYGSDDADDEEEGASVEEAFGDISGIEE